MVRPEHELGLEGRRLAYLKDGADDDMGRCGFFWLGGFRSDMEGAKAETLADLARQSRRPSLRFDYSGHGASGGEFTDGTISDWLNQTVHMFITHTQGKRIVVGSSMGGWLALLLMKTLQKEDPRHARRIAGLVLLAPAADMTEDLMWQSMPEDARKAIVADGIWYQPSAHGSPYPITLKLIEDGNRHLVLKEGLSVSCPVRILQGDADPDVPASHALKVFEAISGADVTMTLIKGGDHRLSTPGHLSLLRETVLMLAERADGITA